MSLSTRFGLLLLAAISLCVIAEFDLVGRSPQETTGAGLRQFDNSDSAADKLRQADAAKNGWLAFWPLLLVLLAALLFWDDLKRTFDPSSRGVKSAGSPIQGDRS